ncbi:hypothetical protein [Nonomuraea sp. NPDC050310]|uniref:hypothetical protein n=1 Tax=Nonomuraea sp. NPDC050310 TaxID=3154935 RepID=UPI0033E14C45
MIRLARLVAYTLIPFELALVTIVLAGVRVPLPVILAAELLALAVVLFEAAVLTGLYRAARRRGATRRAALSEAVRQAVPARVRLLIAHELKCLTSLGYWIARRKHGIGPGRRGFGYFRGQSTTLMMWLFAMTLEGFAFYLIIPWPVLHKIMLILHVYSIVLVLGVIAAGHVRTHVVGAGVLRIRYSAAFDLSVPLGLVVSARIGAKIHDGGLIRLADDRLDVIVSSQTNVTVHLSEPVTVVRPLGRTGTASVIRLYADDPREFVRALSIPEPAARHGGKEVTP